jgi:hypothetical protein
MADHESPDDWGARRSVVRGHDRDRRLQFHSNEKRWTDPCTSISPDPVLARWYT